LKGLNCYLTASEEYASLLLELRNPDKQELSIDLQILRKAIKAIERTSGTAEGDVDACGAFSPIMKLTTASNALPAISGKFTDIMPTILSFVKKRKERGKIMRAPNY
jgi:hypothetical protein